MEKVEFTEADRSYNGEIRTGVTKEGKIVIVADAYYAEPIHEALLYAIAHKYVDIFSTEFHNDVDTSAECILTALEKAKA